MKGWVTNMEKDNNKNNINNISNDNSNNNDNININETQKHEFTKFINIPNVKSYIYFCLDIETTGLDPKEGEILEVFYRIMKHIPGTNNDYKIIKERHELFWSDFWWKTKDIHEIGEDEIKDKIRFDSGENEPFKDELRNLFYHCINSNDPLVFMAQYAPFELNWMNVHLNIPEEDLNKIKVYDTCTVERELYPDVKHSLIPMCERRKITFPPGQHDFHRADQDVKAMFEVAKQQFLEYKVENNNNNNNDGSDNSKNK